jgi:hypothetical protein
MYNIKCSGAGVSFLMGVPARQNQAFSCGSSSATMEATIATFVDQATIATFVDQATNATFIDKPTIATFVDQATIATFVDQTTIVTFVDHGKFCIFCWSLEV